MTTIPTTALGEQIGVLLDRQEPALTEAIAIATQAADGRFVEERLRDVLFGFALARSAVEALNLSTRSPSRLRSRDTRTMPIARR